jgi:tRNA threonylcarbamoyladenosine biosynthesis protein TsaE
MLREKVYETNGPEETFAVGEKYGKLAKPNQVICLDGDLGVGKTVFTKGFARGLGVMDEVVSPTFTIVQEYHDGRLSLYHFDVYRIEDVDEMEEIGYDDYFFGGGVCLIEWADQIRDILPEDTAEIRIEKDLDRGFDYRKITVRGLDPEG